MLTRRTRSPQSALARSRDDPTQFIAVYDEFSGQLLRFFDVRVADPQTALDLTSDTLGTVFEQRASFRGSSPEQAAAWSWRIPRVKLARFFRDRDIDQRALRRLGIERPVATDADLDRVDELLQVEAARGTVQAALAELPADQQTVIRLRYVEELSDQDIAGQLAVSTEMVRARASRGLRRLRKNKRLHSEYGDADDG